MAGRSETTLTVKKREPAEETVSEPVGQKRPTLQRYRLQVDRQTKSSFDTLDAAEKAGKVIKKAYPVVQVAVYDAVGNESKTITA
jgi:hypothetical protein